MGIIIKQSIKNALISYTGVILGFIATIKLFPNILSTDQFGLTRTLIAIMLVGSQISSLGIPVTIIKNLPLLSKRAKNPRGLFFVFITPIFISFLLLSIIFIFAKGLITQIYSESPLLTDYLFYALPLILFSSLFGVLNSFITGFLDTVFSSFLQEVFLRVILIIDLILIFFGVINFETFLIIFVGNYALQFFILLGYGFTKNFLHIKPSFDAFDKPIVKKVASYSMFSFFGGLTMILVGNIDVLMLSALEGLTQTGIYSIAFYVGSVIAIPRRAIIKISFPIISKAFENNKMKEVQKIYQQSSLHQFLGGYLIYIGVWANMDNLYSMLPQEYSSGGIVILIVGLANLIDMISGVNGQIIMSSKYYRYNLFFTSFLVVLAIILNFVFIPILGIVGAAIATGTSLLIYNAIKLIFVWIKYRIHPFSWRTIAIILNGAIVLALSFLIPTFENIYFDILIKSTSMLILYIGVIWVFNISEEFNQTLRTAFKKVF